MFKSHCAIHSLKMIIINYDKNKIELMKCMCIIYLYGYKKSIQNIMMFYWIAINGNDDCTWVLQVIYH